MKRKFIVTLECNPTSSYEACAHQLEYQMKYYIGRHGQNRNFDYENVKVRKSEPPRYKRKQTRSNIG